ncbi:zinc finger ZAT1 [Olea europaea subsp. europaea]|uniref:Zinc finger ZAT1 n=1 Tax=Olea europaea subsp. europaea TaxID=158383 RepID=A0A8S0S1K5_OLEEU|nr:zinc finger ZAT1 [Olea europaea subsp. europaea]
MKKTETRRSQMMFIKMDNNCDDQDCCSASSEEQDLANCLVMLSNKSCAMSNREEIIKAKEVGIKGGHRASHKKVKGCFAAKIDNPNNNVIEQDLITDIENDEVSTTLDSRDSYSKKGSKVHECTVCCRVFSSGQALGGHKRCHWLTSASVGNAFKQNFHGFQYDHSQQLYKKPSLSPSNLTSTCRLAYEIL